MSYKLHPDRSLPAEIARVASEELEKAATELGDSSADKGEAIHDARKRLKKLRGLLRLMRGADPVLYRTQNAQLRDAAKTLSGARDRTALVEALDALAERFGYNVAAAPMAALRLVLERKRQGAVEAETSLSATINNVVHTLKQADAQWAGWGTSHGRTKVRTALLDGLEENYRRARDELKATRTKGDAEIFHDLRKRVKYHAMHMKLLSPLWPDMLEPRRKIADTVAEDLGRDHDYAVMRAEMAADPGAHGFPEQRKAVTALIDTYQDELRASALLACKRLFSEKPKAFRKRIESYLVLAADPEAKETRTSWKADDKQAHLAA